MSCFTTAASQGRKSCSTIRRERFSPPPACLSPALNALSSVAVDEYGNIVLSVATAVASDGGTEELPFVARLTANLELDSTFGQGGIAQIDQPVSFYNVNQSLAVQPNGQYVLTFVGLVPGGTSTVDELGLARLNFNGSLDATFGNQGLVLSSIASGPGGIAVQPDGNLVVAANGTDGAGIVARFLGNPQAAAPVATFTKGPDQSVPQGAEAQSVANWATAIDAGPTPTFVVQTTNPSLFAVPPAITPTGTLTYTPAYGAAGGAVVTVTLHGDGVSTPQTFIINVGSNTPWQNPITADDVDGNGAVTPLDALVIINELNANGNHALGQLANPPSGPADYLDVNGDGQVTPLDALTVINFLNAPSLAANSSAAAIGQVTAAAAAAPLVAGSGPSPPTTAVSSLASAAATASGSGVAAGSSISANSWTAPQGSTAGPAPPNQLPASSSPAAFGPGQQRYVVRAPVSLDSEQSEN